MPEFAAALGAVLLMTVSQLLFKRAASSGLGAGRTLVQGRVLAGLAINALAAICWVYALKRIELNHAFPLLSLNFVLVPLVAHWWLGERISPRRMAAIAIITCGVVVAATA